MEKVQPQVLAFSKPTEWEKWLAKNHARQEGIWFRFYKKDSGVSTVNYAQALEGALCYGWIDGQAKKLDEKSYLQKFTPRRAKSMWSKRNRLIVQKLIDEGRMQAPGQAEIDRAKKDGRWDQAYDSPGTMEMPQDFLDELKKHPPALAFFKTLKKANTYAIAWRLQTAKKPETRERRKAQILQMMIEHQKFHD